MASRLSRHVKKMRAEWDKLRLQKPAVYNKLVRRANTPVAKVVSRKDSRAGRYLGIGR